MPFEGYACRTACPWTWSRLSREFSRSSNRKAPTATEVRIPCHRGRPAEATPPAASRRSVPDWPGGADQRVSPRSSESDRGDVDIQLQSTPPDGARRWLRDRPEHFAIGPGGTLGAVRNAGEGGSNWRPAACISAAPRQARRLNYRFPAALLSRINRLARRRWFRNAAAQERAPQQSRGIRTGEAHDRTGAHSHP